MPRRKQTTTTATHKKSSVIAEEKQIPVPICQQLTAEQKQILGQMWIHADNILFVMENQKLQTNEENFLHIKQQYMTANVYAWLWQKNSNNFDFLLMVHANQDTPWMLMRYYAKYDTETGSSIEQRYRYARLTDQNSFETQKNLWLEAFPKKHEVLHECAQWQTLLKEIITNIEESNMKMNKNILADAFNIQQSLQADASKESKKIQTEIKRISQKRSARHVSIQ